MTAVDPPAGPSRPSRPPTPSSKTASAAIGAPLQRTTTSSSLKHAHNSLRRMATHETGEIAGNDRDGVDPLHTHEEHEDEHDHASSQEDHGTQSESHEEAKVEGHDPAIEKKRKKVELQDQTNILPTRQIIMVMFGLSCALFCSLLDQTM